MPIRRACASFAVIIHATAALAGAKEEKGAFTGKQREQGCNETGMAGKPEPFQSAYKAIDLRPV